MHKGKTIPAAGPSRLHRRWVLRYEAAAEHIPFFLHEECWARDGAEARRTLSSRKKHVPLKRVLGIKQLDSGLASGFPGLERIDDGPQPFCWLKHKHEMPPL